MSQLIDMIAQLDPLRPIQILAHSLGARVALCALRYIRKGHIGRMILLAGAAYTSETAYLPESTELFNVTTRENDLFDLLFETAIPAPAPNDRSLGHGVFARNMLTVQLDQPATLKALETIGFKIAPPAHRVCHWSPYLRDGVFPLYRALLCQPDTTPLATLRARLPRANDPHWSRLFPPFSLRLPLPFPRQTT
jgi:pimeloyl-ACP methyl ester carboxylesterase